MTWFRWPGGAVDLRTCRAWEHRVAMEATSYHDAIHARVSVLCHIGDACVSLHIPQPDAARFVEEFDKMVTDTP